MLRASFPRPLSPSFGRLLSLTRISHRQLHNEPLVDHLKSRGLLAQLSNESLQTKLEQEKVALYCGADPSADSLHVGNLIPLIVCLHFYVRGHTPYILVGGATGQVGDPSGRSTERQKMEDDIRAKNIDNIQQQMKDFFKKGAAYAASKGLEFDPTMTSTKCNFVNNASWWKDVKMLDFLATYGRHIRINQMIARDSVKNRLATEQGLGFNEFSYQILQAYDFWHLYKTNSCVLQVGGNDQWGNITAGIDLISRLRNNIKRDDEAYGLTVPLLTTASGEKFGKSAGNAIWLDPSKTKPYDLYQYFVKTPDEMVEKYLKIFTLIPLEEIAAIIADHSRDPESHNAQRVLASEVTDLIHGLGSGHRAQLISSILFTKDSEHTDVSSSEVLDAFEKEGLCRHMEKSRAIGQPWRNIVAVVSGKSKSEASRLIKGQGVYYGLQRSVVTDGPVTESHVEGDNLLLIRIGKTNYHVIRLT